MSTVEYYMKKIYGFEGGSKFLEIKSCFVDLYNEYRLKFGDTSIVYGGESSSSGMVENTNDISISREASYVPALANALDELNKFLDTKSAAHPQKSCLEMYLGDSVHPRMNKFDVLAWWKLNAPKYPIVACMARDILSIPVSAVASEFAFSTGGRVLGSYRCSMHPTTVEGVICSQDWLRNELRGQVDYDGSLGTTIDDMDDGNALESLESQIID